MTREPPPLNTSGRADPGHVDSLVAAAPDLLKALKRMTAYARQIAEPVGPQHSFWDGIIEAETAIAKAEGR